MNPFFSVWLHPKQTARFLIEQKTLRFVMVIVVVGFMASAILGFQNTGLYPDIPYVWLALMTFIGSPLLGLVMYFIMVGISLLIGRLFGGTGTFWDIGKALSLSYIPMIVTWPVYIIWLFVSPESFFLEGVSDLVAIIGNVVMVVMSIWSFIITVGALAEAHRYSNWRAFFTMVIPGVLLLAAVFALLFFIIALFTAINM